MSLPILPSYSSPDICDPLSLVTLPAYSSQLEHGEQRLGYSPRTPTSTRPTSIFITKTAGLTISLDGQAEGSNIPIYGRNAAIIGSLGLDRPDNVLDVVARLEGQLDTTSSESGSSSTRILDDLYRLWSSTSTPQRPCPTEIPFRFTLPSTTQNGRTRSALPPTYEVEFSDPRTLRLRILYQLRFTVRKSGVWQKKEHTIVPFKYCPLTRSQCPILPHTFLSSLKSSPEEWLQTITPLSMSRNPVDSIYCHLFIPSATGQVYSLKDHIPFHIQWSGTTTILKDVFSNSVASGSHASSEPTMRVFLLRQIEASIKRISSWRNVVLGEGRMRSVPPQLNSTCRCCGDAIYSESCLDSHVDWEGELRCTDGISVGSFGFANMLVKDFITLLVSPPAERPTLFLPVRMNVPIRLVTDSFSDLSRLDHIAQ